MNTTVSAPTFRPLHSGMLALCLDAVETYDTEHRLDALTSGAYQVAWTGPGFARGWDNRAASELVSIQAETITDLQDRQLILWALVGVLSVLLLLGAH